MTAWPSLPLAVWRDTCATLHLWMQIAGKIRLVQTPWTNHSWHVTARGLSTSPIPHGNRTFKVCTADSPDDVPLEFLESTYGAAATLAAWDRASLERP